MGRFNVLKDLAFLISIIASAAIGTNSYANFLTGNVPYDIYLEMKNSGCTPISDFYSLEHTGGTERTGPPFDETDLMNGSFLMVALCEETETKTYKAILRYKVGFMEIKTDYCGKPVCSTIVTSKFAPTDFCGDVPLGTSFPGGIKISPHSRPDQAIEFTLGYGHGVRETYKCVADSWQVDVFH